MSDPSAGTAADYLLRFVLHPRLPLRLARVCWFLALLTEAYRGGSAVAMATPLGRFRNRQPSVDEVLHMTTLAAIGQLSDHRQVFEAVLVPQLASRQGP